MKNTIAFFLFTAAAACAARYGDADHDGLDAWQENAAGTNPTNAHTFSAVRLDYDYASAATGVATFGELYDDGDLMPPMWELAHGLDEKRFDADEDPDDDGWTNGEEWIAGTDPSNPSSRPAPRMEIELIYDGTNKLDGAPLCFMSYSDRTNQRIGGGTNQFLPFGGVPDATYEARKVPRSRLETVANWQDIGPAHARGIRGGFNSLLGWLDLDKNGRFDPRRIDGKPGEPMGLSLYNAVWVGPDSFKATISLTDELFGFPRLAWRATTNDWVTRYQIQIWNGAGAYVLPSAAGIIVEAPRTFMHEGDWIESGIKGLNLGTKANDEYRYAVFAWNGAELQEKVGEGVFRQNTKNRDGTRLATTVLYPTNNTVLYGPLVEFRWKMDWRTEGVFLTIKKGGNIGEAVIDRLYVPFPVRHNKLTDDDYYYTYVPQLENGSVVSLDPGTYWWEVEENLNLANYTTKKDSGTFQIQAADATTRSVASISGNIHYYGRLTASHVPSNVVVQAYRVSDQARTSLSIGGNPVSRTTVAADGSFALLGLKPGTYGVIGWVDADGDGLFGPADTQGFGFLGNSAAPILPPDECPPLRIAVGPHGNAVGRDDVHVVLRDRDPNGDGIPDSSGFPTGGTRESRLSALLEMPLRTFPAAVPTGSDWISPSIFSTNTVRSSY